MSLRRATATVLVSIGVAAALGCAASDPSTGTTRTTTTGTGNGTGNGSGTGSGTGNGAGGATGGGTTTGGGGSIGPINPGNPEAGADIKVTPDAACAGEPVRGEKKQVDLLMMMDSSGSMDMVDMGQTLSRWDNLAQAIPPFVNDTANAGMMIGLDFFPEVMGNSPLCNATDYSNPNVPVELIPGPNNMQASAITSAIQGRMRGGGTPTTPALQGAIQSARTWQMAHPERSLSVLFLTDGQPQGCNSSVNNAAQAAMAGFSGMPSIKTYVLGVGPQTGPLDTIAAAGGTRMAYMVTNGGAAELQKALAEIRKSTLSCDYSLPKVDGGMLDPSKVNVSVRVGPAGTFGEIFNVGSAAGCTDTVKNPKGEGWYYDTPPPGMPTKITLCQNSCGPLQITDGSEINVLLGCVTKPIPPPALL
jgi:hypothetical protein